MNLLALDLGTKCGYAYEFKGIFDSGVFDFTKSRHQGGGMRYLRFRHELDRLLRYAGSIGMVVYEEVRRHRATDAAHVYGGLLGVLSAFCEEHGIPYEGIPVGTIKKYATGKGNADKEAVMKAMRAVGYDPKDDNEADALALYFCVKERIKQ